MEIKNIVKGVLHFIKEVQEAIPKEEWNQFCEDMKFSNAEVEEEKKIMEEIAQEEADESDMTLRVVTSDQDEDPQ